MSRTVVRLADLQPPREISDEEFDAICGTAHIPLDQRAAVRTFLAECVTAFSAVIVQERRRPTRKQDRLSIERAVQEIRKAIYWLKRARGSAGRSGLRVAGRRVGPIVAASWLRDRFPDDNLTPARYFWPPDDSSFRSPARVPSRPMEVDDLSLNERIHFLEHRAGDALPALLGDLAGALDVGHRYIVQLPDGRKPLEVREYMLAALAEQWHRLVRRPTAGKNSPYGAFCESVFDAIGWPTEGVNSALGDAIKTWRSRYRS